MTSTLFIKTIFLEYSTEELSKIDQGDLISPPMIALGRFKGNLLVQCDGDLVGVPVVPRDQLVFERVQLSRVLEGTTRLEMVADFIVSSGKETIHVRSYLDLKIP